METEKQRFKELRIYFDMGQEEWGEALGIKQGSVSDIEGIKKKVGVSKHIKNVLYNKFKVNPKWLENGTPPMILKEATGETDLESKYKKLADYYKKRVVYLEEKLADKGIDID